MGKESYVDSRLVCSTVACLGRLGWPASASVKRFVGQGADEATRKLQYRFNKQSRTPVWRRMANGALPVTKMNQKMREETHEAIIDTAGPVNTSTNPKTISHKPSVILPMQTYENVIDISKDQPVYDPRGLERAGIHYHKFPTVSKIPPQPHEIEAFIKLVDEIREKQAERAVMEEWNDSEQCVIGVTATMASTVRGILLSAISSNGAGFDVKDAIETFAKARPNGIRHSSFSGQTLCAIQRLMKAIMGKQHMVGQRINVSVVT
ncbi:hypothetical protein EDB82DRAFT_563458 [Fusarium venenatum]|uniref:uncharacterized protein n=1 Tax=Fusarium venenatum TaxID=56646 RepID=UPI001DB6C112|nr:hypothetical protein EDB82DRAFT_563458 [Fusarium venenatum]